MEQRRRLLYALAGGPDLDRRSYHMKRSAVAIAAAIAFVLASAALAASSLSGKHQTKITGHHSFGLNGA